MLFLLKTGSVEGHRMNSKFYFVHADQHRVGRAGNIGCIVNTGVNRILSC